MGARSIAPPGRHFVSFVRMNRFPPIPGSFCIALGHRYISDIYIRTWEVHHLITKHDFSQKYRARFCVCLGHNWPNDYTWIECNCMPMRILLKVFVHELFSTGFGNTIGVTFLYGGPVVEVCFCEDMINRPIVCLDRGDA